MVLGDDGRCPLAILVPFTSGGKPSEERDVQTGVTHMAAALMAMEDFNDRDPSVVPQLSDDAYARENCSVYFPLPWHNRTSSAGSEEGASEPSEQTEQSGHRLFERDEVHRLHSAILDDGDKQSSMANALLSTLHRLRRSEGGDDAKKNHHLCAVAGNIQNLAARTASTLAAASDVPYFSHGADTTKISRPPLYPLSGKTVADEYARGEAVISYFDSIGRDKVALAYSHTNEDVLKVTSKAARDLGVELRYFPVSPPWDGTKSNTPYDAMKRIKESGFKTVILALPRLHQWEHVAREAERWGVNTDEYVWFVWEVASDMQKIASTRTQPGSDLDKILRGMGSVRVLDGYDWQQGNKFLTRWKGKDNAFVEKLNYINPIEPGKPGYFKAESDYFKKYKPMQYSSFMYDTVIALGMGACRTQKIQREIKAVAEVNDVSGGNRGLFDNFDYQQASEDWGVEVEGDGTTRRLMYVKKPGPNLQFNETVQVTFDGASGFVKMHDEKVFARDHNTIGWGVYNIRPIDDMPPSATDPKKTTGYEYVITSTRIPGQAWAEVPGVSFIYTDGTSTQPTPVREVFENNYLTGSVRTTGLALYGIAAFICISLATWTFARRRSTIIRAAQPEFMYLLCFGSLASLTAIVTLSFDESYGTSVRSLSAMCTATPWLFFTGYIIIYMALFSKLRRINSVLSFRRRQVKAHHVILPAAVLTLLALIILALWTALDPWVWVRETVDDATGETFGRCTSNNATAYIVPLAVLMIVATLLAAMMAYKTKDISSAYSEATPIFFAISTEAQPEEALATDEKAVMEQIAEPEATSSSSDGSSSSDQQTAAVHAAISATTASDESNNIEDHFTAAAALAPPE
ncbi:hypothetical protein ACHAWF_016171 [Thalassiosira exigua]